MRWWWDIIQAFILRHGWDPLQPSFCFLPFYLWAGSCLQRIKNSLILFLLASSSSQVLWDLVSLSVHTIWEWNEVIFGNMHNIYEVGIISSSYHNHSLFHAISHLLHFPLFHSIQPSHPEWEWTRWLNNVLSLHHHHHHLPHTTDTHPQSILITIQIREWIRHFLRVLLPPHSTPPPTCYVLLRQS